LPGHSEWTTMRDLPYIINSLWSRENPLYVKTLKMKLSRLFLLVIVRAL